MSPKLKSAIKYILSVGIAVVLLYFSFRGVNWGDFWASLKECRWGFVLLSIVFATLAIFMRGVRWQILIHSIDDTTKVVTCFNAINIGYLINMALPRVGELARCGFVTNRSAVDENGRKKASFDKVFGTVLVERSLDVLTLVVLIVVMLLFMWQRFGKFFSEEMMAPLSEKLSFNASWLVWGLIVLIVVGCWLIWKLRDKSHFCKKICDGCKGVWEGAKACLKVKNAWLFVLATVLIWICYWLMSACTLWAVQGIDAATVGADVVAKLHSLDLLDVLFLMIVGALSSVIPVPGGFGAFHYLVSLALLSMYGIPMQVGVIFATLSHESQMVEQIVVGFISYVYEALKK